MLSFTTFDKISQSRGGLLKLSVPWRITWGENPCLASFHTTALEYLLACDFLPRTLIHPQKKKQAPILARPGKCESLTVPPVGLGIVAFPDLSAAGLGIVVAVTFVDAARFLACRGQTAGFAVLWVRR